jgi:voltage-gated potassium channel
MRGEVFPACRTLSAARGEVDVGERRVDTADRLQHWEHRVEWPLAAVALLMLVSMSVQVIAQPQTGPLTHLSTVVTACWAVFVVDYVTRLTLAPERGRWFVRHLPELAIVALPFLRPLRLLRLVVLVTVLQKAVGHAIRGRVAVYAGAGAVLLIWVASLAALQAERGAPQARIVNIGDTLWWSITTMTTVGYGDTYPVTTTGRVVAALLMIGGISLLGTITATIASWIVQRVAEEDTLARAATAAQVEDLRAEIRLLREQLAGSGELEPAQPRWQPVDVLGDGRRVLPGRD